MWEWIIPVAMMALEVAGSWWSTSQEKQKEQERIDEEKRKAQESYRIGKEASDKQYTINRDEAQAGLDLQGRRLDQDVGSSIGQFNTSLLAQAYGIQDAQIQTASGIGASRAAEGMSGTRGNAANELVRAYAQQGLDRNIGLQYQQNDQALSGMITQANRVVQDISRERASWDPGGYRYELKGAEDTRNKDLADLGISALTWQSDQVNNYAWMNYTSDALKGGMNGFQFGTDLYKNGKEFGWWS
jgi:hypothetical protein